jgi:hypothetical protein
MEKFQKNAKKFNCDFCDFYTCKLSNYNKHILTSKHKKMEILQEKIPKINNVCISHDNNMTIIDNNNEVSLPCVGNRTKKFQKNAEENTNEETHETCSKENSQEKSLCCGNDFFPKKMPLHIKKYSCQMCDFNSNKIRNYNMHLLTLKHLKNVEKMPEKNATPLYSCLTCNKIYNSRNSLWYHEKKCKSTYALEASNNDVKMLTTFVVDVVKQNQEFQKMIVEQNKQLIEQSKTINYNTNNNCNNTINNKFNLQVFLNDKCKDALSITEFIDSLKISFQDLENVGSLGYVEGISKIFVKGLKQLDVYKRPIHCSDLKRETMYIKEQNNWEKDSEDKDKLKMVIKNIAHKNTKVIPFWRDANPSCLNSESKQNDQYMKILYESMGPCNELEDNVNYEKIIHNVAKEVIIDKKI